MTVTYEVAETIEAGKKGLKSAKETREVAEDVTEDVAEELQAPQE
jgi:hypothetical protein